jgi:hypothetical protein
MLCAIRAFDRRPNVFVIDKRYKDDDHKGSVAKKSLVVNLKERGAKTN